MNFRVIVKVKCDASKMFIFSIKNVCRILLLTKFYCLLNYNVFRSTEVVLVSDLVMRNVVG